MNGVNVVRTGIGNWSLELVEGQLAIQRQLVLLLGSSLQAEHTAKTLR